MKCQETGKHKDRNLFSHEVLLGDESPGPGYQHNWWMLSFWLAYSQILTENGLTSVQAHEEKERQRQTDRGGSSCYKAINPIWLGFYACDFM